MTQTTLPTRRLGQTGLTISALAMGGAWIGRRDDSDAQAIEAVHRAFEHGINFFDTDPGYDDGKAEPRLGQALATLPRDAYAVCTKVGTRPGMERDLSAEGVRRSVEQSLEALRVEHLDVLLIHDPSDIEDALAPGAALDEMQRLKQEGLTRYIGLGCRSHAFHRRAIETGRLDALLTYKDYTLLDQSALHDTIPLALQWGVGLMLASPLDMGALTGIEPDAQKHPRAHAMWQWCAARGVSLPALALQFCLSLPVNGGVLTGPATAAEVDASVKAATEPIDEATWDAFAEAFDVRRCFEPAALRLPGDGA